MAKVSTSTFWQLERVQTALRMRQSQARFWRPVIGVVWLLCSAIYLWVGIGAAGRASFAVWVKASFWGWLWPRHLVAFQGHWYAPQTLASWLQQTVYGNPLSSWLLESLLMGMVPALAGVLAVIGYARRRSQKPIIGEHIRGVQLVSVHHLQQQIDGSRSLWQWRRPATADGVKIAGVVVPRALETSHFVITGSTGTGKSTILRRLLQQIAHRGETAIVLDPECQLTPEFYDPQRHDVILNPSDRRCPYWSPWCELAAEGDAETLASSVIPDPPERGSSNEHYFVHSARELFVALLHQIPTQDPHALSRVLFGPLSDLLTLIKETPAASHVVADASDQRAGIISTLQIALRGFRFLPPESEYTWSARAWQEQRTGWLFLPSQEQAREAVSALHSIWLDALIRRLLDTDLARAQHERVWIIIDELATVRRLQHLEDMLTRGRKRGVAVVLGFQAIPQLRKLYGRESTATLLAAPAVKLFLRVGEPDTARWCSDAIGGREVIRPFESETAGPEDLRDAISVSYQRKEEALVLTSELQLLPNLQGYLTIAGYDVARVTFPALPEVTHVPGFLPRAAGPVTPPSPPSSVSPVPPAPPRMLVMKPLPVGFGTTLAAAQTSVSPPIPSEDAAPTQQLDLFPRGQKRRP
jgi:hypothetical protein